jgi:PleD family two-component response regulator
MSTPTILAVDDTEANLDILVELLSDDYEVAVAIDGERALLAAEEECPDLILLDIMMPGMDGYEVCRVLKSNERTSNIPIIFLTALTKDEDEERGLLLGAVDYITKPFNPALVMARVKNHLDLRRYQENLEELVEERTRSWKSRNR